MNPSEAVDTVIAALNSPNERVRLRTAVYVLERTRTVPEPGIEDD